MANWYATSDTWFSANEVGAWTPATTATAPHGTPTTITAKSASLKPLKQQPPLKTFPEAKQPSKTKKLLKVGPLHHLKREMSNFMHYRQMQPLIRVPGTLTLLRKIHFREQFLCAVRPNFLHTNLLEVGILRHLPQNWNKKKKKKTMNPIVPIRNQNGIVTLKKNLSAKICIKQNYALVGPRQVPAGTEANASLRTVNKNSDLYSVTPNTKQKFVKHLATPVTVPMAKDVDLYINFMNSGRLLRTWSRN